MSFFQHPHPMAAAPAKFQAIAVIAETVSLPHAQSLLHDCLTVEAACGDRQAAGLLDFAIGLDQPPQTVVFHNRFGWLVETTEQAVERLVGCALGNRALTPKRVGQLFGAGLISEVHHDGLRKYIMPPPRTIIIKPGRHAA